MNTRLENVYKFIIEHKMIQPDDRVVAGLSGGADSVCLLHMLCALSGRLGISCSDIVAVHVHHGLRGAEADRDAEFAERLCERLGVLFVRYDTDIKKYARQHKLTVEEAGRKYRYECFEEVCEKYGCNKIAVAHNKNDMAETVLFHAVRGSGMRGLRGILPVRGNIVRPLLHTTREEICAYLAQEKETYCEDSTNAETAYARNRIRHEVLPALTAINQGAPEHLCSLAEEAADYFAWAESETDRLYAACATERENSISISTEGICGLPVPLRKNICYRALTVLAGNSADITSCHIADVLSLVGMQSGKRLDLPYGITARRSYERLVFEKRDAACREKKEYAKEISVPGVYEIPDWGTIELNLVLRKDIREISKNQYTKMFDYDKIKGGLSLRGMRDGDFMTISETGNRKRLSRLFADFKVDAGQRSTYPLLVCADSVVWAVGLRESALYRIDSNTQRVLVAQYKRKEEQYGRKNQRID